MPGVEIEIPWPVGKIVVEDGQPGWDWSLGATRQEIYSADPNEHYRPWMERNVGRQGWDWNWKIGTIAADNGTGTRGHDTLTIKLRRKHAALASFLAIKWG